MTNEERLIKVYQEAQQRLVQLIALKEARGNVTWYQETLLKQVNTILRQLRVYSDRWVQDAINESYSLGAQETAQALAAMGVSVRGIEAFARLHTASVEILTANTQSMLLSGISFVGRQVEDVVRQAGLEAIAQKQATGATVKEAAKLVKQRLVQEGLNGVKDRRGRMISLDAYAATVARTTTREATNTATMNQLQYEGYDLVKMSKHNSPCPVCSVYEGRVYSIDGKNPNYPTLSIVFHSGHAVIHPNCRHVLAPYIVSLADDPDGDRRFSNRPFNVDDRSKKAVEAYNNRQSEQRKLRADRMQFQRYKLVLGEEAPKTLGGFRRMKSANSERWNELQTDYRDALKPEDKAESFDTNGKKFAEMRAEEDKLRPLKKEVGIVYNTSGQEVWRQSGEMATVDISGALNKGVLKDNILTHNHPRGTSFSDTDIYVMAQNNMAAIRAVTKNHTYEAQLSEDFKQIEPFERARMLKDKVKEYEAEVKKELSMPINGKEISLQTATLELWHRVWERIANNEKWITYTRKINK